MMNGLVFVCTLLVADSLAKLVVPVPVHPSQGLIDEAEQMTESRIVNGDDATIGANPWQVSLRSSNSHICGGSILNSTAVITAAHCVDGSGSYTVRYGSGKRTDGGSVTTVTKVTMHPSYDSGAGLYPNDIAVLRVEKMHLHSNAQAIPLNSRSNSDLAGLDPGSCRITGWGRTSGTGPLPDTLQGTNVKILTDSTCKNVWGNYICNTCHICLQAEDGATQISACNGDSGGPLVCANGNTMELVGVTSWGASGCPTTYPSVYAEVNSYRDFLINYSA
ncbi:fibrinolytic enzyme, isozyme C-like [Argopecten irradians]|uniref:fibrinolytic enzyme, isozyme C-like n=1 Tax=Argopecten irradians TaxID=31199 RepID=UPI00371BC345